MYRYVIRLTPKDQTTFGDDAKKTIFHFLFVLHCSGQILKNYHVIENEGYHLHVTTPKQDSLSEAYDSIYVKRDRTRIDELFTVSLDHCGIDLESQEYCTCQSRNAMELETFRFDVDSVFTCCDCFKPIALYELPYLEDKEDHNSILLWQDNYAAMDMLWMNCLCDRYTGNQRVNPDSALNKQGRAIAGQMSLQVGYPVYYHLACDYGKRVKAVKVNDLQIHICPECQTVMKRRVFTEEHTVDLCEACMLSYDAH